ncbi:MAG TPA: serine/threonine-protein kinase [Polyangiales bacterium]
MLARLASGGMAGVYVARAIGVAGFERLFAIKILHPHLAHEEEFISMFLDEARLAARIRHPNVVPTIDISDTPDAGFYLVMEYIEGDHLGALLQRAWKIGARLPWPITLRIVVDALDGLAAAHNLTDETGRRLNLVHRDVSPHNVMVSTDGIARITDFGVAKAEVRLSTTREGQFKGKLAYMAPEHASNGEADQRSDIFSMAIILWECLTGRRLFRAENHAATLNKICLEPIPMPSSVDPALAPFDHVLERGLARDPNQRFQSAEEFAEAIELAAPSLGGVAKQREVAQVVREYAAEKIAHDANLIRSAIAQLAIDGPTPQPPPSPERHVAAPVAHLSTAQANQPVPAAPPPIFAPPPAGDTQDAAHRLGRDVGHDAQPAPSRRWVWVGLLFALVAAIGVAIAMSNTRDEGVHAVQLAREPAAPPPVVTPAPAPAPAEPPLPATAADTTATAATADTANATTKPAPAAVAPAASEHSTTGSRTEHASSSRHRTEPKDTLKPKDSTLPVAKPATKPSLGDDLILNPYRH